MRWILPAILTVVLFLVGWVVFSPNGMFPIASLNLTKPAQDVPASPSSQQETQESDITVPSGVGGVSYLCLEGLTAFTAMQAAGHEVSYSDTSLGKLVNAINGIEPADGKYWLYSIDGQEASVGADSYDCRGEEMIEWELK
jgi:hypothetical protein